MTTSRGPQRRLEDVERARDARRRASGLQDDAFVQKVASLSRSRVTSRVPTASGWPSSPATATVIWRGACLDALDLEGRGLATQVGSPSTVVVALDGAGAALPLRAVAELEPHGRCGPQAAAVQENVDAVHVEEAVGLAAPRRRRRGFALLRLCHLGGALQSCTRRLCAFFQSCSKTSDVRHSDNQRCGTACARCAHAVPQPCQELDSLGAGDTIRRPLRRPAGQTHRCGWRCAGINRKTTARWLARAGPPSACSTRCIKAPLHRATPHEDEWCKSVAAIRTRRRTDDTAAQMLLLRTSAARKQWRPRDGASAASAPKSRRHALRLSPGRRH